MADKLSQSFEIAFSQMKDNEAALLASNALKQQLQSEDSQQSLPPPPPPKRKSKKRKIVEKSNDNIEKIIYYNPTPSDNEIEEAYTQLTIIGDKLKALNNIYQESIPLKDSITKQDYDVLRTNLKKIRKLEDKTRAYQILIEDPEYEEERNNQHVKFQLNKLSVPTLLELTELIRVASMK